jgi:hypothetical protein
VMINTAREADWGRVKFQEFVVRPRLGNASIHTLLEPEKTNVGEHKGEERGPALLRIQDRT